MSLGSPADVSVHTTSLASWMLHQSFCLYLDVLHRTNLTHAVFGNGLISDHLLRSCSLLASACATFYMPRPLSAITYDTSQHLGKADSFILWEANCSRERKGWSCQGSKLGHIFPATDFPPGLKQITRLLCAAYFTWGLSPSWDKSSDVGVTLNEDGERGPETVSESTEPDATSWLFHNLYSFSTLRCRFAM